MVPGSRRAGHPWIASWLAAALLLAGCGGPTVRQAEPPAPPPPVAQALPAVPVPPVETPAAPTEPAKPLPIKVALLVPLSGNDAGLGRALLESGQLALFDAGEDTLTLLPRDTAPGAANAARLALEDGASLVLGPLYSHEVGQVATLARPRNVPVIAFSTDRAVAGSGVYLIAATPEEQVARVVAYAVSQGLKRIALLGPDNAYGNTVVAALKVAAERQKLELKTISLYGGSAESVPLAIKRLVRGTEPDFDALLLPEGGARLRTVVAQLAGNGVDPQKVKLLGTALWSTDQELAREPGLVGAWLVGPPPDATATFADRFARLYGHAPPGLAGLAYDAVALAAVMAKAAAPDRFTAAQIQNPSGFAGYEGVFRFRADGLGEHSLAVLEVQPGRGNRVIADAPQSFATLGQ